jgi:hypothetical protein
MPKWVALAVALMFGYAVWSLLESNRQAAHMIGCEQNMRQLSRALLQYANNHNERLPPANRWMDCIDNNTYLPGVDRQSVFRCPAAKSYGYAMNAAVGGMSLRNIAVR